MMVMEVMHDGTDARWWEMILMGERDAMD